MVLSHQWFLRYLTQGSITSMGSKNVQLEHISTLLTFCAFQTLQTMSCELRLNNSAEKTVRAVSVLDLSAQYKCKD